MPDDSLRSITYKGSSMNPTLKAPCILQVLPYQGEKIQRGDVIVFHHPGDGRAITHRVVCIDSHGIRTRGDNSSRVDPWVVGANNIVGRVIYVQRGDRQRSIYGGLGGRLYLFGVRAIRIIDSKISSLIHPVYHRLAQTGAFRRWLPARMQPRVLSLDRSTGTELQLLMGRRVIGRLLPGRNQWVIRRPFQLFVTETSLPAKDCDNSTSSESTAL